MFFWDYVGDLEGLWEYAWGQSVGDNMLNSVYAMGKCVQDFMADEKIHKPTLLGPHFALLVRKCSKFVFFRPVFSAVRPHVVFADNWSQSIAARPYDGCCFSGVGRHRVCP